MGMLSIKFYFVPNVVFSTNFIEIRNYVNRKTTTKNIKQCNTFQNEFTASIVNLQNVIHIHLLF